MIRWQAWGCLASAATLSLAAFAPTTAVGAPTSTEDGDGLQVRVEKNDDHYAITYYHNHVKRGSVAFQAYGEHLYACDLNRDGSGVSAALQWWESSTQKTANVSDRNGSKPGCGHQNLDIDEGTWARLRICVGRLGCESIDVVA